jgi:hypothetical protein
MALLRANAKSKMPAWFGDTGMHFILESNWTKAKFFEVDFSAAVVVPKDGVAVDKKRAGRPRYLHNIQAGLKVHNCYVIFGKDGEGNYWLGGYMTEGLWDRIGEMLEKETW